MKCRSCGTEIADKAIVCFRCGTPTDLPAAPARPAAPRGRRPSFAVVILLIIIAAGVWLLPGMLTDGAAVQWTAWAGLVVAAAAAVWLLRRRR